MKKENSLIKKSKYKDLDLIVFLGPYLLAFAVFTILPVVLSVFFSFTNFNMMQWPDWVGLKNYSRMFLEDDIFMKAFQNTLVLAFITGPLSYIICFSFAWVINEVPPKPRSFLTLLFYSPALAGGFDFMWQLLFVGDKNGYVNAWLLDLGLVSQPVQFMSDTRYMWQICILMILWQSLSMTFLTFIAGLQTVDKSLYEASAVDGIKNRWQELYFVTLPCMRGQLLFGAILSITSSFGIGPVISNLFGYPSQGYELQTITLHMVDYGQMRFEVGYASAIAVILFILSITANRVVQYLIRKIGT